MRLSAVPPGSGCFLSDSPGKPLVDKKEEQGGFSKDNRSHGSGRRRVGEKCRS